MSSIDWNLVAQRSCIVGHFEINRGSYPPHPDYTAAESECFQIDCEIESMFQLYILPSEYQQLNSIVGTIDRALQIIDLVIVNAKARFNARTMVNVDVRI